MIDYTKLFTETVKRQYFFDINGEIVPNETDILAKLLDDGVLFCNNFTIISDRKNSDDKPEIIGKTITLFVNCNDVFAWGFADSEDVVETDLKSLFELHMQNPKCGSTQWVCIKRNEKPQRPVIKWMKENNGWNETLEALPNNKYDEYLDSRNKNK